MSAVPTAFLLGVTLFALRLTGQGLMGHTSLTSMGRYFGEAKGRAVSIATLGFAVGEAIFPSLGVGLKALVGWRNAWFAIGAALAVALVPLVLWLLKGHEDRHSRMLEGTAKACPGEGRRQWTVCEVLFDWRFYLALPAVLAPAFIATGFFFHQVPLVHAKGWSLAWFAGSFVAYAGATVVAALLAGPIVDRTGATRLLPFYLLPLGAALLALATSDHPAVALIYMLGVGFSMGAGFTILGVIWAEMYGVLHLGAIRSLVWALMVFAGALAPVAFGFLIDLGTTMETIAMMCLLYAVLGEGLAALALKRPQRLPSVS